MPLQAGRPERPDLYPGSPAPGAPPTGRALRGEFRLVAVLSIVAGILLLLENLGAARGVHHLWPLFPAFIGAGFLLLFQQRQRRDLILLGFGTYLLGVSVLFFVCTFYSWRILASAWPLFVALLGLSSILCARFARRTRTILFASGLLLVLVAAVLWLVLEVNPGLWPVSLVLFGIWVLLVDSPRRRTQGRWNLDDRT